MIEMNDVKNIEKRIEDALNLKKNLESKVEKLPDSPRKDQFQIQLDKVNELIAHLEKEKEELSK